jgi:hypothetical protein
MKKIFFAALMGTFALATTSCNKDATEIVDKTEYDVILLVEGHTYNTSNYTSTYKPLKNAKITLLDYDKTYTTDGDGKATLTLPQGRYRLTVESSGYDRYYSGNYSSFDGEEYYILSVYGNTVEKIVLTKSN